MAPERGDWVVDEAGTRERTRGRGAVEGPLRARLDALYDEGHEIWRRFDVEVRRRAFHPFVPADYDAVERMLLPYRDQKLCFLEWGSATGVITIMADLLGFEAFGIEIDARLVEIARDLARRHGSAARFVAGSFLPSGYRYRDPGGGARTGTIADGASGYLALGHPLEDFDVVFGYPWAGEEPVMRDVFRRYGGAGAKLLIYTGETD